MDFDPSPFVCVHVFLAGWLAVFVVLCDVYPTHYLPTYMYIRKITTAYAG